MPRIAKELTAAEVKKLKGPSFTSVGGVPGLHLSINTGHGKSWILRVTVKGRRADIGLGGYPDVTLAQARDAARGLRTDIKSGIDPVAARQTQRQTDRALRKQATTFAEVADAYLTSGVLDSLRNEKHRKQWRSTIETYALPFIGKMSVDAITATHIKEILLPIWTKKHETASRLRARIEQVFEWAIANGFRKAPNPATFKGNLKQMLPTVRKNDTSTKNPAIQVSQCIEWFAALGVRQEMSARALELLCLTAARSGEIRLASWPEFDLENKIWIIPAERMKMGREHRVPLSKAACNLIEALPRFSQNGLLFPNRNGDPLSDMTLSKLMKRMHEEKLSLDQIGWIDRVSGRSAVPHGLRSTFRDWAAEKTNYPSAMAEIALAHLVGNEVERAYRRGDMLDKRRKMMNDWADYLTGQLV